ncbi:MAG TPA: hypothetical protein VFT62_07640 [Mycobacteriales bacterium]|nr:hypothetical protein [Mycobacteriales bacterium]
MSRPAPPGGRPPEDEPEWWRRSSTFRRVPIIAVIVLVIILLRAGQQGSSPPPLRTSCTTPAFALSSYSVSSHATLRWAVTGPARSPFVLTIGARTLLEQGTNGQLTTVPDAGVARSDVRSTGVRRTSSGCTDHGAFGIALPAGRYEVRLFRVTAAGSARAAAQVVATKTLTVTS